MTASSTTDRLSLSDISLSFGTVDAVRDVSLTVAPGEIHCLLGPSGSGKSTLLRVIAGLERQQRGAVALNGTVVSDATRHQPAEQRPVGFVFQDYALFPHLSAHRNVLFGMPARRSHESRERASQLLTEVGLASRIDAMPHTMSGGEQQRVALARALARTPQVMLLDEPFSGLDVQLRADVRETTLQVLRKSSVATVMVTHDPSEAISCADQISVMHAGRITQSGPPLGVYHCPEDDLTAETFGIINRIPAKEENGRIITAFGEWPVTESFNSQTSTLSIRPEQLTLHSDNSAPHQIEQVRHEGTTTLYVVHTEDGSTLYVRTLSTSRVASGTRVRIGPGEAIDE